MTATITTADKAAEIKDILETISYSDIESVYLGRHGCACGCIGTHTDSERSKKIIATKMLKAIDEGTYVEAMSEKSLINIDTATRSYIIYFN